MAIAITAIFLAIALIVTFSQSLKYGTESKILVVQNFSGDVDAYSASRLNEYLSGLLVRVISSESFFNQALDSGFNIDRSYFSGTKNQQMKQWENTSTPSDFSEFAREGDQVDEEIFNYFWGVLPPVAYEKGIFQVSEPYSQRGGYFTYSTFQEIEKKFYFLGYLTKQEVLEVIEKDS